MLNLLVPRLDKRDHRFSLSFSAVFKIRLIESSLLSYNHDRIRLLPKSHNASAKDKNEILSPGGGKAAC